MRVDDAASNIYHSLPLRRVSGAAGGEFRGQHKLLALLPAQDGLDLPWGSGAS